ncbi:YceI family protein [Pseudoclavibacter chungangensis]|uniref:YceI family protein n=1 Tax=Pseudoclavibacter chungangensis TaxID=587635 RepID=A0A7J5BN52_9MICO|nr:YceI family protein [Pseudoclavibacter chungangensis]KAB1653409.1 YceI family protein [Pseudoclavibacter chungangensis]KAB1657227.1 YceI family protein [Pseudoclavibacter chungangensis]NYJ66339.1 polyisoprenoid-binding protein YceI [Pseudoclavibacter chungangensis]
MAFSAADVPGWTAGTWALDPTHTDVTFQVRHLAISKVKGSFEEFTGTITTGDTIESSSVEAEIQVASVNTNQAQRDEHLRTNDFFLASEYPTITFRSTGVRVEEDDILVDGELTLRGVTKPVTLDVEFGGVTVDGYGNTKLGFEAQTKINRKDFGVSWNAPTEAGGLTLGDEVKITIDGQAALQK